MEPTQLTFEEIEAQLNEPKPADLTTVKIEGDTVPEHLKGKSADELLKHSLALEESLKKSEQARLQPQVTERIIERQSAPPAPAAPQAKAPPTKEQLAEMFQTDPVAALETYGQYVAQTVYQNLEQRLGPLAQGSAQAAERQARERFKDEFELFGEQIEQIKKQLPDPSVLSQPQSWDDLVAYVRGQPQNFDKLYDHRVKKAAVGGERTRTEAQTEQIVEAPVHLTPAARTPTPRSGAVQLDDTAREIARNLGMSEQDYIKWSNIK